MDQYVLEPAARGWDWALPEWTQRGIRNFFDNLQRPRSIANNVLQLKPRAALEETLRLLTNTTFGVAGFIDVWGREGLPDQDEDLDQTLGYWGLPSGPYLVLPLLGPSTPRSAVGLAGDSFASVPPYFIPIYASIGAQGVRLVNLRARFLEEVEQNRRDAFDYYVFLRDAFLQNLEKRVRDGGEPEPESEDDLYYFDDEELEQLEDF